MFRWLSLCALAVSLLSPTSALAQGGATASLSGVVVDPAGGVIPGATVVVKNDATGATFDSVTNGSGAFSVPALDAGTYTVTVSLEGFKTAVVNAVRLVTGHAGERQGHARSRQPVGNGRRLQPQ